MKRAVQLRRLSSDHHRALVMAKKARRIAQDDTAQAATLWQELEHYYVSELDEHFRIEESHLGKQLAAVGRHDLLHWLQQEHAKLRTFFQADNSRSVAQLHALGELLAQHVRFEERELFNVAQELLGDEHLQALLQEYGE